MELNVESVLGRALELYEEDPYAARSWIYTAYCLFPDDFDVVWHAYKWEMLDGHIVQAAKFFGRLVEKFSTRNSSEFKNEICAITSAIRATDNKNRYGQLFDELNPDVQQTIFLLTVDNTESPLKQIDLLFLILNRYSSSKNNVQAEALLELLANTAPTNPLVFHRMIVQEALPLLERLKPRITPSTAKRTLNISFEYYLRRVVNSENQSSTAKIWKNFFDLLTLFARIMNWELFMAFDENLPYSVYWDKLLDIMSRAPAGSTCVLYYATVLFLYTLDCYMKKCNTAPEDDQVNHILVESFTDWRALQLRRPSSTGQNPPLISVTTEASKQISCAFVHAAQCWQLLNTEQFQRDFDKLLVTLPLSNWMPRFLFDLALYFGHRDEAKQLFKELRVKSNLVYYLQKLSLSVLHGGITPMCMDSIVHIMGELPKRQGNCQTHLVEEVPRHLIFIPLEQRSLVQYCARAIIENLSYKLYMPNCAFKTMGNLLVLLQIEYPIETAMVEQIFHVLKLRRVFYFRKIGHYITNIHFLEEIMHIYNKVESLTTDFGILSKRFVSASVVREFRSFMRQQMARSHENIIDVVANFIVQEQAALIEDIFRYDQKPDDMQFLEVAPIAMQSTLMLTDVLPPPLHPLPTSTAPVATAHLPTTVTLPEYMPNRLKITTPILESAVAVPVITATLPPPLTAVPVGVITPTPISRIAAPSDMEISSLVTNVPVIALAQSSPIASPDPVPNSTTEMMITTTSFT